MTAKNFNISGKEGIPTMMQTLKNNWFMLGLIAVPLLAVGDITEVTVRAGLWLKQHHGPDTIIVLIFLLSGLALNTSQIKQGVTDYKATIIALLLIFIIAPLLGFLFIHLPLQPGILIGLLLVSTMPTTLSSGVVMTGGAGGNMAHALLITIIANILAVFTIPWTLGLLISAAGESREIVIDQVPIMIKIAKLVLLPLLSGIVIRNSFTSLITPALPYTSICNQLGILTVVWMGCCQGREAIISSLGSVLPIIAVTAFFHILLIIAGIGATKVMSIPRTRRESVILMGGQKTLPLSIILQVSLFAEYGLALVVCVLHHIVHLAIDAYLVQLLKQSPKK